MGQQFANAEEDFKAITQYIFHRNHSESLLAENSACKARKRSMQGEITLTMTAIKENY